MARTVCTGWQNLLTLIVMVYQLSYWMEGGRERKREREEQKDRGRERERCMFTWMSLALQPFMMTIPKICSCAIFTDVSWLCSLPGPTMNACCHGSREVCHKLNSLHLNFLTIFRSMSRSLQGPNIGGFSAKWYHSICITLLHNISPYYHQVSAVLLVDGCVSLTQLQMMSSHDSQQGDGTYVYQERERERERWTT